MSPVPDPPPAADSLAACLARLAVSAPLAQGCLDAGQDGAPGALLASLSIDFAWAVTDRVSQGVELGIGLRGLPLSASLAVLHTRVADSAARIRFEVQQTPAGPASTQGAHHA